jgi:hypothetical protein
MELELTICSMQQLRRIRNWLSQRIYLDRDQEDVELLKRVDATITVAEKIERMQEEKKTKFD